MSEITEEQAQDLFRQFSESKANTHSFFTNVIKTKDTTKTGNLSQEELGMPKLPARTLKELALFSRDIADDEGWADWFDKLAEIQTSTSLSKDALLLKLAVTTKKELADVTPTKKKNGGWFKSKRRDQDPMSN